jgi:chaperonin GroES
VTAVALAASSPDSPRLLTPSLHLPVSVCGKAPAGTLGMAVLKCGAYQGQGHSSRGRAIKKQRNPNSVGGHMKFRPLHDRVVVKRIEAEEKSVGGIIIPDTAKEKPSQGEVIAVGPGGRDEAGKLIPIEIKEGDRVLFGKWSGTEVKIDGQDLLIMKESDIMGIIDEPVSKKKAA